MNFKLPIECVSIANLFNISENLRRRMFWTLELYKDSLRFTLAIKVVNLCVTMKRPWVSTISGYSNRPEGKSGLNKCFSLKKVVKFHVVSRHKRLRPLRAFSRMPEACTSIFRLFLWNLLEMKDFLDSFYVSSQFLYCLTTSPIKIKLYEPGKLFPEVNRNQLESMMQLSVKHDDFDVNA